MAEIEREIQALEKAGVAADWKTGLSAPTSFALFPFGT